MNKQPSPKHESNKTAPVIHTAEQPKVAEAGNDSLHGQGLLAKVEARKADLEHALRAAKAANPNGGGESNHVGEIEKALESVKTLLTGNLDNINDANATSLTTWMETSAVLIAKKGDIKADHKPDHKPEAHKAEPAKAPAAKPAPAKH